MVTCIHCKTPLNADLICPKCGKIVYTCSNVSAGIMNGDKVDHFYKVEIKVDNQNLSVRSISTLGKAVGAQFGLVGALVGAAADAMSESEKKAAFQRCDPLTEITAVEWPIKERYGSGLNSLSPKNCLKVTYRSGEILFISGYPATILGDLHGLLQEAVLRNAADKPAAAPAPAVRQPEPVQEPAAPKPPPELHIRSKAMDHVAMQRRVKICLKCQLLFSGDKTACTVCGSELADKK